MQYLTRIYAFLNKTACPFYHTGCFTGSGAGIYHTGTFAVTDDFLLFFVKLLFTRMFGDIFLFRLYRSLGIAALGFKVTAAAKTGAVFNTFIAFLHKLMDKLIFVGELGLMSKGIFRCKRDNIPAFPAEIIIVKDLPILVGSLFHKVMAACYGILAPIL